MNSRPFRILVIEDNPTWYNPMIRALERDYPEVVRTELVKSAKDAREALLRGRFHLGSHDLHIPGITGDNAKVEEGVHIMQEAGSLLLPQFVLSGFLGGPGGLSAARISGRLEAQLFSKSPGDGLDHGDAPPLSAQDWARLVGFSLGLAGDEGLPAKVHEANRPLNALQYRPEYWRRASQQLPDPLAHAAQIIFADWNCKQESTLRSADRYAEWTLRLAWAQTAVLLRALGGAVCSTLNNNRRYSKETEFLDWLEKGKQTLLCCPSWQAHLTLTERGTTDLAESLKILRQKRNSSAHSTRDQSAREPLWRSLDTHLLTIMDIAAFWAQFPLFGRVTQRTGGWEATAIRGTARVGPSLVLPENTFLRSPPDEHVFQRVPVEIDGQIEWRTLNWYPWLQFLPDADFAAERVWLLSHKQRDDRWVQICLSHDETRIIQLDERAFR